MTTSGVALAFSGATTGLGRDALATQDPWVRDERFLRLIALMAWVLTVLMIVPEGFDYTQLSNASAPAAGSAGSRLLWLLLLVGGTAGLVWRAGFARLLLHDFNLPLLIFVLLAAASVLWSADPPVTLRRLVRVLTVLLAAISFVLIGWHARRFQNVLRPLLTAVLAASILFGLIWPQLAIHQETEGVLLHAWHGLANHKNGFGNLACIALIFWVHAWLARETSGLWTLFGSSLAITCLLLSRSSTSMVAAVFTGLFLTLLLRSPANLRRYMPMLVSLSVIALLTYSLAMLNLVPGLDLLLRPISLLTGKDLSFTGRTEIWDIVSDHIRLRPLLGSGYGAYWVGATEGSAAYDFVLSLNFYPGSSHNGYLEVMNDLGAFGLLVLIAYLMAYLRQSLRLLRVDRVQAALYLGLFLQQAVVNLSESRWLNAQSIDFVIMTLATAALARSLLEHRMREYLDDPAAAAPAAPAAAWGRL